MVTSIILMKNEDLSAVVTEKLRNVEHILTTETMLAFQAFSKHDLESMFSLGLAD